jgi:hypothetical protein
MDLALPGLIAALLAAVVQWSRIPHPPRPKSRILGFKYDVSDKLFMPKWRDHASSCAILIACDAPH